MLAWDMNDNAGYIKLKTENGEKPRLNFSNASEFFAISTIIQHEAPVYYDENNQRVFCGAEMVDD